MKILFLHGWNSVVGGVKPTYLEDHGHEVINPALPHEDFTEAVRIAPAEFEHEPKVVVESSRGGAVAMNIDSGEAKLVLLCPAWKKYGTVKTVKPDTVILHSRAKLIEVGTDHRLGLTRTASSPCRHGIRVTPRPLISIHSSGRSPKLPRRGQRFMVHIVVNQAHYRAVLEPRYAHE